MGKIEIDHTGAGAGITLSSDGTDLLLDGTAIGGGGAALELYAENPVTHTTPTATGANAVAIGTNAQATNTNSIAITRNAVASGNSSFAAGNNAAATGTNGIALGANTDAVERATAIGGAGAQALQQNTTAIGSSSTSQPATCPAGGGAGAMALAGSYASGTDSFAAAIANNTSSYGATGANSIAIGYQAKATQTYAGTFAGFRGQATGAGATSVGGFDNIASGSYSIALGGRANTSDGQYSYALGYGSHTQGVNRRIAFAGNGVSGETQSGWFSLGRTTANATPIALTTDVNGAPSTTNQVILPNNSAYAFHGTIVARQQASTGTATAAWKIEGLIRREGTAGTTVLVNSATTVLDNTPAWGMALTADVTNGGLAITVTGAAATNIRWVATIHTSEVTY